MNAADLANMPAFPVPLPKGEFSPDECLAIIERSRGMTLRQHYAALVMQAEITSAGANAASAKALADAAKRAGQTIEQRIACNGCEMADALIAELAKPATPRPAMSDLVAAVTRVLPFIDDAEDVQSVFPESSASTECRDAIASLRALLATVTP